MHDFRANTEHVRPVECAISTFIFTGEFDPQTHRSNGSIIHRSLKNSQLAEVRSASHSGICARVHTHDDARLSERTASEDRHALSAGDSPLQFGTELKAIVR
jgi:hypothetical protein